MFSVSNLRKWLLPEQMILKTIALCLLLCFGCKKEPRWLSDFAGVMDRINRDLEGVAPLLAPEATPQDVFVGLKRLDKISDQVISETQRIFTKYPEIRTESKLVEIHLAERFKRMRENMRKTIQSVGSWRTKLKNRPEYEELIKRLEKKAKLTNSASREP